MKLSIRNSLFLAGGLIVASAIISKFQKADLIWSTLWVIIAVVVLILGYREDKGLIDCLRKQKTSKHFAKIVFGLGLVFLALTFAVGKLIYLWTH